MTHRDLETALRTPSDLDTERARRKVELELAETKLRMAKHAPEAIRQGAADELWWAVAFFEEFCCGEEWR